VYDTGRHPVVNARVELRSDTESDYGNTKTDATGRFVFVGMPDGRYTVRVLPLATDLAEQSQDTQVTNVGKYKNDVEYVEFYLTAEKRRGAAAPESPPEVLFTQDIPAEAKKLYADGVDDIKTGRATGMAKLEQSIQIAPNYFDALSMIGKQLILQKEYEKSYPYLLRAIDINPRSFSCYFRLGYAFYQMKQYPAAVAAAKASTILSPDSLDAQLLYGTVARINGNYSEAEPPLLKADKIANSKNAEVHMQLALLYNHLNKNDLAVDQLKTYLKLEPHAVDKDKIEELIAKLSKAAVNSK